jgi:hypothetical protein
MYSIVADCGASGARPAVASANRSAQIKVVVGNKEESTHRCSPAAFLTATWRKDPQKKRRKGEELKKTPSDRKWSENVDARPLSNAVLDQ